MRISDWSSDVCSSDLQLLRGMTPRERAVEIFSTLRVWDTEHNNGVLIYILLADRSVEIVADRGVGDARVPPAESQVCCRQVEAQFRSGRDRKSTRLNSSH